MRKMTGDERSKAYAKYLSIDAEIDELDKKRNDLVEMRMALENLLDAGIVFPIEDVDNADD